MNIEKNKFSLAAAGTMGILYALCAAFVSLWPDFSAKLFGWLIHLVNLEPMKVTATGFLGGLIQILVYTYIGAYLFAWLHNRFMKS